MKRFPLTPAPDKLIIKRDTTEQKLGSIFIPNGLTTLHGQVMAMGQDVNDIQDGVEESNKVLYTLFSGDGISIFGEEYDLVNATDIIAII